MLILVSDGDLYLLIKDDITLSFLDKYFLQYSNIWVFYSCLATDTRFLRVISLLNIINEEKITSKAPIRVFEVGISSQII